MSKSGRKMGDTRQRKEEAAKKERQVAKHLPSGEAARHIKQQDIRQWKQDKRED